MRKLLLIRHAKSSWKYPELQDHDRPLNARGERDRWRMAEFLVESDEQLQCVFTSTAVRAKVFAETIAQQLGITQTPLKSLYAFAPSALVTAIRQLPDDLTRIAVVGHNPAITELANQLSGVEIANVPTSGIVSLRCEINTWHELAADVCSLDYFVAPKLLVD